MIKKISFHLISKNLVKQKKEGFFCNIFERLNEIFHNKTKKE